MLAQPRRAEPHSGPGTVGVPGGEAGESSLALDGGEEASLCGAAGGERLGGDPNLAHDPVADLEDLVAGSAGGDNRAGKPVIGPERPALRKCGSMSTSGVTLIYPGKRG